MFSVNFRQFRACKVFHEASDETIDFLCSQANPVAFNKDQQICIQGDDSTDFYLIVGGYVRMRGYAESGKAVSYGDIGPGNLFGEFAALDKNVRSTGIVAVEDVLALKLPASALQQVIESDGKVAMSLILSLIEKTRTQTGRVFEFSVLAVRERIQHEILRIARNTEARSTNGGQDNAVSFEIPTHQELAERLCTHREAVTRELGALTKLGLIEAAKNRIDVPDVDRLSRYVDCALDRDI